MFCRISLFLIVLLAVRFPTSALGQAGKEPPKSTPTQTPPAAIDDTSPIQDDIEDEDDEDPYSDEAVSGADQGVFGNLRIGPSVALAIPHIFEFGIDGKYRRRFGFGAMMGSHKTKSGDVNLSISSLDIRGRYHLFDGALFLGANLGKQTIIVRSSTAPYVVPTPAGSAVSTSATVETTAKSNFVTPHVGWQAEFDSGLTLAFELGVQFVFGATVDTTVALDDSSGEAAMKNTSGYKNAAAEVDDKVETWAKKPLPYITLLRAGWLF